MAVLALAATTASSGSGYRTGDTYLPQLAIGTSHPLVFASLGSMPRSGFTLLPTSPFTLKLENDFPISIVYSLTTTAGGSVSKINPDPFERFGVIGPGRTLTLNVRLSSLSSNVQATVAVTSVKAIAVNVLGDAVFGSFLPLSLNDLNNLFDAAQGGIGSLINQIASDAIQPFVKHAISTTTAIARLSKLLIRLGTNRTYRVWLLQHLGKRFDVFSVGTLAARAAEEIGAYAGLAGAHVPGQHTLTVALQDIPSPQLPSPPQVTGVSGNSGVVGAPPFPVTVHFRAPSCDIVGGTWTDQLGVSHPFRWGGSSSVCSNGVGSLIPGYGGCTSPTGQPGHPGSYTQTIVLRDSYGQESAPFSFQLVCAGS